MKSFYEYKTYSTLPTTFRVWGNGAFLLMVVGFFTGESEIASFLYALIFGTAGIVCKILAYHYAKEEDFEIERYQKLFGHRTLYEMNKQFGRPGEKTRKDDKYNAN